MNVLSDAEAVDDTSHVYGSVSGSQIADAIAAHAGSGTFVAANPSGTPTDQLKTVTIGSTVLQVRSTFSVKYLSDRPVADEETVGHVYHVLQAGQAYFGVEDSHQSTTPSGSFNNVPNRSDLHVVATLPTNLNNLSTGDFYYHAGGDPARGGFEFYEVVVRGTKQLQNVHASRALAASRSNNSFSVAWLGSEADSTEALAFTDAISSTTNYFFHNETTDTIQRLVNSSYSGPTVEPHYRWLAIGGGGGGAEDGVADSLAFAVSGQDVTATLGRSIGADLTASFTVPGGGSGDDAFDWATVGNTDLVPVAKLGPGVANADRILRGNQTWGRINANMLTASFVDDDPPDEADYMLFADSGPGRLLSFKTYGSVLDGLASDTKVVTALPDPEDVADADKDKIWLVVPTADTGVDEVAHFKPAGDTTVFTMTAADHTYGSGLHLVGTDKVDRLGHLEPNTNLHDIYWEDTLDTYYIEFKDGDTTPFDYTNYTAGLSLYFREQGATGNWRRVFLAQQSDDNEFSSAEGVANHFVGGTVYDVIIRATSTTAGVHSVSSVPSTIRLEPHPGGGSFRSLVDEDELGQITTVTQEVRQVDGEVNDFTLAYASGTLTGTVERSIGADIVATAMIPEGLPLAGGTITGDLIVDGSVEITRGATSGIALSITKTDTGGNPVVRMIHPDNTGNGQRPFNARRDGESDYFEVNGRLGGTNDNPGWALGTGSGARDARMWRGGPNLLETDDALQVDELRIGGTVATTRTNLGLGALATEDDVIEAFASITRQASLTWNVGTHPNATLSLTGNVSSLTLSGDVDGGVYTLVITQDSTGGRTFAFPSGWEWAGGTADTIASGASAKTVVTIRRVDSTIVAAPMLKNLS